MDLYNFTKNRKTVRKFKKEASDLHDVIYTLKILKKALLGKNSQPWKFLLISEILKKQKIREICEKVKKFL